MDDKARRHILENLADAVVPFNRWASSKKPPEVDRFIPELTSLPWRPSGGGSTLTLSTMRVLEFFDQLFGTDSENEQLVPRWRTLKNKAPAFFPRGWRLARGLNAQARFGAFESGSGNMAYLANAPDGSKDPATRSEFYTACWDPLEKAYTASMPKLPDEWVKFADKLLQNGFTDEWPAKNRVSSAEFVKAFALDILHACLGQTNTAIPDGEALLRRAVLIEAAENRHIENKYGPDEAARAVAAFDAAVEQTTA